MLSVRISGLICRKYFIELEDVLGEYNKTLKIYTNLYVEDAFIQSHLIIIRYTNK